MQSVNMLEAKTNLSRLVEALEQGTEREIVIARNGRPVARLLPIEITRGSKRIGVAKGKFKVPDDMDADADAVTALFLGSK